MQIEGQNLFRREHDSVMYVSLDEDLQAVPDTLDYGGTFTIRDCTNPRADVLPRGFPARGRVRRD